MPQFFGFAPVSVPGPKALPVVGTFKALYDLLEDPIGVLLQLRTRGDVVALVDRNPAVVCVFGPERNREVLTNPNLFQHDEHLLRGPKGSVMDRLRFGMVMINGNLHRRHRKLLMPAFQKSALDAYATQIVEVTRIMLGRWNVGEIQSVDVLCRETALAMAMRCLYGLDVSAEAHDLGQLASRWVELVTEPSTILLPFDVPGSTFREVLRMGDKVLDRLYILLRRKREMGGEQKDAMALVMNARDEEDKPLEDDEIIAEAASLFMAGYETMAMSLTWALFLLERHPGVQEAVRSEMDVVLGQRDPEAEDLPRLVLLDRVIKESMRLLTTVPMLFMRVCADSANVGGFALPNGANLLVSPLATHHDPNLYPEPRRFLPDRWLDKTPVPYAYLPFGAGPRTCIGMLFAERALRIILPMILRRFRFSVPEGTRIDRLTRGNTFRPRNGLPMRIENATTNPLPRARITGNILDLMEN
ncbi:MAG TPA: cytochrome P450 [Polyangium sp.]|nr:cytochrome P450 [Polyangium sp.]